MMVTNEDVRSFERDVRHYARRYGHYISNPKIAAFVDDGIDERDDLLAELRLKAALALSRAREKQVDPKFHVPFVRLAIKNFLLSKIRKAEVLQRRIDGVAICSALADVSPGQPFAQEAGIDYGFEDATWRMLPSGRQATYGQNDTPVRDVVAPSQYSPEVALLKSEEQAQARDALDYLRSKVGRKKIQALHARMVDEEPWKKGTSKKKRERLLRVKKEARALLGVDSVIALQQSPKELKVSDPITAEDLPVDVLARTLIVLALADQVPMPTSLDKPALVAQVRKANTHQATGEVVDFPFCFTKEFDPHDAVCSQECDFRAECSANHPKYHRADVDEVLVQIVKGKVPAKPRAVQPPPAPAPAPLLSAVPDSPVARVVPVTVDSAGKATFAPPPVALGNVYIPNKGHKTEYEVLAIDDRRGRVQIAKAKGHRGKMTVAKALLGSTEKNGYTFVRAKPTAPAPTRSVEAQNVDALITSKFKPLSERRAVFRRGQKAYKLTEEGKRWFRAPQGSAVALANLPVGTVVQRVWRDKLYRCKKIQDGRITSTRNADGTRLERKRDGQWRIVEIRTWDAEKDQAGEKLRHKLTGVEGSLTQLAFAITDSNTWSGAKFFSVLPPELDRHSDAFNPEAYNGGSLYRYSGT